VNDTRVPGVLFDVDGTLLDTNYLHVLAWWEAMRDAGHEHVSMAAIHRTIGIASEGLVEHLLGHEDQRAVDAHSARYEALREKEGVVAFPDAAKLLDRCSSHGLAVVLATSGKEEDLDWMRPAIGVDDALSGATTSSQVEEGKPSPALLTAALEEHRLDPARTVVVGDTVWDVEAATHAGLPCLAVTSGGISEAELREAGAAEVYVDPADLLARFDASLLGGLVT
jgi:HAD superfamily hydrolase (TIGR01509 family)